MRKELRAELLATASAAGAEHLLAARGGLAGEETVTTGAHEIAGLEGTLHIILEKLTGAFTGKRNRGRRTDDHKTDAGGYGKAIAESSKRAS